MIFYEKEKAEEILKSGFTSFMNFNDLSLLAKYFKYIGKNKKQIKKSLIEFCIKYNSDFNESMSRNKINNAIKQSQKYGLRFPMDVKITESEIEKIKSCGNHNRQKVLFVMIVIAKYFKYNDTSFIKRQQGKYDNFLYANESITGILKMAKVNVSKKERMQIQYDLQQLGLITSVNSKSFQIHFVDELSDVYVVVNDMNNIVDFYKFYCQNCGKIIKNKSKKHDFCKKCYEKKLKKNKNKRTRQISYKNTNI